MTMTVALEVANLRRCFAGGRRGEEVVAVDDVSLRINEGTTLGLVGESGSGKSTVARCVLGLVPVDGGTVDVLGRRVTGAPASELRSWRRDMQIVFQESFDALDPRLRVGRAIAEPLLLHSELRGDALRERVRELLGLVDLAPEYEQRLPHELSGGQQQRVNIARAIATHPRFVVLDEPTSSLDVSVRAGVLKLLVRLQRQLGLTYLLISHDLPTVRSICDRVAVMHLGRILEEGPAERVLSAPQHSYTRYLLSSELSPDPDVRAAPLASWSDQASEEETT